MNLVFVDQVKNTNTVVELYRKTNNEIIAINPIPNEIINFLFVLTISLKSLL